MRALFLIVLLLSGHSMADTNCTSQSADQAPISIVGDAIGYSAGVIGVTINIPQIVAIFRSKDSKGISMTSQSLVLVTAVLWTAYGVLQKNLVITATSAPCIAIQIVAIVGTHLYRNGLAPNESTQNQGE